MLHMLCLSLASAICAVTVSSPLLPGSRTIVLSSVLAKQQQRGKTFSTVVHNARDSRCCQDMNRYKCVCNTRGT